MQKKKKDVQPVFQGFDKCQKQWSQGIINNKLIITWLPWNLERWSENPFRASIGCQFSDSVEAWLY